MKRLAPIALLVLAACQGKPAAQAPAPRPAAPVAAAPAPELAGDLDALGTEPFWAAQVRGDALILKRPADPDVTAQIEAEAVERDRAAWRGRTASGVAMTLNLRREACSDGMSDRSYAFAATATLGRETFQGCAAPLSSGPDSPP